MEKEDAVKRKIARAKSKSKLKAKAKAKATATATAKIKQSIKQIVNVNVAEIKKKKTTRRKKSAGGGQPPPPAPPRILAPTPQPFAQYLYPNSPPPSQISPPVLADLSRQKAHLDRKAQHGTGDLMAVSPLNQPIGHETAQDEAKRFKDLEVKRKEFIKSRLEDMLGKRIDAEISDKTKSKIVNSAVKTSDDNAEVMAVMSEMIDAVIAKNPQIKRKKLILRPPPSPVVDVELEDEPQAQLGMTAEEPQPTKRGRRTKQEMEVERQRRQEEREARETRKVLKQQMEAEKRQEQEQKQARSATKVLEARVIEANALTEAVRAEVINPLSAFPTGELITMGYVRPRGQGQFNSPTMTQEEIDRGMGMVSARPATIDEDFEFYTEELDRKAFEEFRAEQQAEEQRTQQKIAFDLANPPMRFTGEGRMELVRSNLPATPFYDKFGK
jgi:hypothetical protein